MLCLYLNNNPDSELFLGKSLRLGGSKELYKENGTVFGDLSAILIDNMPFWAEFSSTPSNEVSLMPDWETKMQAIVDETINENVTSLLGVPSWVLVLLNQVLETTGRNNLFEIWPNLEVYLHGGVSFYTNLNKSKKLLPKNNFLYYETGSESDISGIVSGSPDAGTVNLLYAGNWRDTNYHGRWGFVYDDNTDIVDEHIWKFEYKGNDTYGNYYHIINTQVQYNYNN